MSAYWIANVTIFAAESYQVYQALASKAFVKHGAKFLARGEAGTREGAAWQRRVV